MSAKYSVGKIIDFEVINGMVRFYLGLNDSKWGWVNKNYVDKNGNKPDWLKPSAYYYGDHWDDIPYEHNAGKVHDVFIVGVRDYFYDSDWIIVEPCTGVKDSHYCKNDLKKRDVPCVIVIKNNLALKHKQNNESFQYWYDFLKNDEKGEDYDKQDIEAFYFEDILMAGTTVETSKFAVTV